MKNLMKKGVYVFIVLAMLMVPSVGMLAGAEVTPSANEILTQAPKLVNRDGAFNWNILKDVTSYVGDHFALRKEMATAWADVNMSITATSVDDQIILGRDGWLFYADTVEDYAGIAMSDEDLESIAKNLAAIQEYVESQGATFVFTIVPNKNSVYPQYMTDTFRYDHNNSSAVKLKQYLAAYGVNYADLFEEFSSRPTMYYKTDSHWNSQGAALATDVILSAADRDSAFYDGMFTLGSEHVGDLYEMLYPAGSMTEADMIPVEDFHYEAKTPVKDGMALTIKTENVGAQGSIFCWRDSFGATMYRYMAEAFGSAAFSRDEAYDFTKHDIYGCDVVVIEIVERNLDRLVGDCYTLPEA